MAFVNIFNTIVKETFTRLVELHPEESINLGLGVVDKPLPDLSTNTIPIERGLIKIQLEKLEEIDPDSLPLSRRVDYFAFRDYLKLRLFFLDDWPLWKMYPDAPEIAFSMILSVYLSDSLGIKEKVKFLFLKMEELPIFLERSKSRLELPIQLFIDSGILSSRNLVGLLKGIYNDFISNPSVSTMVVERKKEFNNCIDSVENYVSWLQSMRAKEVKDYTMGKKLFEKLLKLRRIEPNVDELEEEIKLDLETYKKSLMNAVKDVKEKSSVNDIIEFIEKDSPKTSSVAMTIYQHGVLEIKKFIKEKSFISLPDIDVEIKQIPTMIHDVMPLVHYLPIFHQIGELRSVYLLINVSDDPTLLKMHNVYMALHRLLMTAYPGYHTVFTKSLEGKNYVRMLLDVPEFLDGWSVYSDFIVGEYGFLNSNKDKFIRSLTLYRNALLAYLDIKVNTGETSHLEALNTLIVEGYLDKNEAITHILKIVISPTRSLSPYIGYKGLWNLRESFKILLGKHYDDRWFNDTILKHAILPIDLIKVVMVDEASKLLMRKAVDFGNY